MKIHSSINPTKWMRSDEISEIAKSLLKEGLPVRFVGGCVRDVILGINNSYDIDIVTPHVPEKVIELLKNKKFIVNTVGKKHGTVSVASNFFSIQITTLRKDVINYGRRALVEFTNDWNEDAYRRDFTINSIYLDSVGNLYDPVNGIEDLNSGVVRFIGDPEERIKEDFLRILRFFRFVALYLKKEPDYNAFKACSKYSSNLSDISKERITNEFLKILSTNNPCFAISAMISAGVIQEIFPEATRPETLELLVELEHSAGLEVDPILRLSALLPENYKGNTKPVNNLFKKLIFTKKQIRKINFLQSCSIELTPKTKLIDVKKFIYFFGYNNFCDYLFVSWARLGRDVDLSNLIELAAKTNIEKFPLNQKDLNHYNELSAKEIRIFLEKVEEWWINNNFSPSRKDCLSNLEKLIKLSG